MDKIQEWNIGYIIDIITKKLIGCIANNKQYLIYYTDNNELSTIIECILTKKKIQSLIGQVKNENTFFYELSTQSDKMYLHGFSFLLSFPYHINRIEYKRFKIDDLYKEVIQQNESINEKTS